MMNEIIVGIDLGTTNSEVAVFRNGNIEVIPFEGETIMPSAVGFDHAGNLLVGTPAKNQAVVFPERTVLSIKRRMGTDESVQVGGKSLRPQEISAMILRELKRRAEVFLGGVVKKAVITVPAFFSEAQRKATHDAGEIAGFEVMRILNEPTAASLAYESSTDKTRQVLVYDLGGGTFDVSVVETHGEVTEVLASHGDTKLGGDDFDRLLLNEVVEMFIRAGNPDPRENRLALSRLKNAVVKAKHDLSIEPYARIREENLIERDGVPLHMDLEISRVRYEELIRPLVEKTFESVGKALSDAGKKPVDLDAVLLVGGMTRTPLVERRLTEVLGKPPRRDVHPDLAVALGAGAMAARLAGAESSRILVDITPYSFGPEVAIHSEFGFPIPDVYSPIIKKGTPLPTRSTGEFHSMVDNQEEWKVNIYQGEHPVASRNILIGEFIAGPFAPVPAGNPVTCTLELDLDGILNVTVIEKNTGLTKKVRIENALGNMASAEIEKARKNLDAFFAADNPVEMMEEEADRVRHELGRLEGEEGGNIADSDEIRQLIERAQAVLEPAEGRLTTLSDDDRREVEAHIVHIRACLDKKQFDDLPATLDELDEILYFTQEAGQ